MLYFTFRFSTTSTNDESKNVIKNDNLNPTSQKLTDNTKDTSNKETNTESATSNKSKLVSIPSRKSQATSEEVTKPAPTPDKREDLTALKALDVLLRRYDRRSTPTNDLGTIYRSFMWKFK